METIRRISGQIVSLVLITSVFFTATNPHAFTTPGRPLDSTSSSPAPIVSYSLKNDTAPLPRNFPRLSRIVPNITDFEPEEMPPLPKVSYSNFTAQVDTALQSGFGATSTPSTSLNFAGVSNGDNGAVLGLSVVPPDTNGAVGPNHYVQIVNLLFAVYSKTGTRLYGPAAIKSIWAGFGGDCETHNDGDPIVLYDHFADRWLISQPAWSRWTGPYYQCIAISTTGDPTGTWNRYVFLISTTKMNDYPKFGVWPDGYYMSVNQFTGPSPGTFTGAGAVVFDRSAMLNGLTARMVYFDLGLNLGGMLPSDPDGPAPPVGSPNYFVQFDNVPNQLEIWQFHVDWTNTVSSTFTALTTLATAAFDPNVASIPQPGTTQTLDTLSDRLMYRLQYRNFGSYETLVVCHTVNVSGHAGMRWYDLHKTSSWSIYQQGTYAPDSANRWMGSIAMDSAGNLAMGYSVSSSSIYPSIRYTGRWASDPLGTMGSEVELVAGAGSQTGTKRWGDYSSMSVDPSDGLTFWYTQEYYDASSARGWRTRIGSFKFSPVTFYTTPTTFVGPSSPGSITACGGTFTNGQTSASCSSSFSATANLPSPSTGWLFDHWEWTGGVTCTSSSANPASCSASGSSGSLTAVYQTQVTFGSGLISWGSCANPPQPNGATIFSTAGSATACYVPVGYSISSWSCSGGLTCSGSNDPTIVVVNGPGTITLNLKSGVLTNPASTSLTASASPNPLHGGTSFTVSGALTNSSNGVGLAGEQIVLVFGWNLNTVTVTTQPSGSYTYTATAPMPTGSYNIQAFFLGDYGGIPQYLPSKATAAITVT